MYKQHSDQENRMSRRLNGEALDVLFRNARTYSAWRDQEVSSETLRQLYDLMKLGPTSMNCCPARVLFIQSKQAKERLRPALLPGNVDKTMAAPVTAILAYDEQFYEKLSTLWPHNAAAREMFASSPPVAEVTAFRNGTLQGGYFILAARSLGLDCGPMSGFDNAKVDAEFFPPSEGGEAQVMPVGRLRSNFLCNLGYGDDSKLRPRAPRLEFDEACQIL